MLRRRRVVRGLGWISGVLVVIWFVGIWLVHSAVFVVSGFVAIGVWDAFVKWLERRLPSDEFAELQAKRARAQARGAGDSTLLGEALLVLSGRWFGPYEVSNQEGKQVGRITRRKWRSESGEKLTRFDFVGANGRPEFFADTRQGPLRAQLSPFEFRIGGLDDATQLTLRRRGLLRTCEISTSTQMATLTPNGWPSPNSTIRDPTGRVVARISITSR